MSDWADDTGRAFIDNLDANELDLIEGPEAPFRRLAVLLRKAKADGMREAAEYHLNWPLANPTNLGAALLSKAEKIEKGNA